MKNFVKLNYYYSYNISRVFLKQKKTTQYTPQFATMTKEETNNDFFVTLKKRKFKQKILSRNFKKNHVKLFSLKFISYLLSYNIIYECTTFSEF